MLLEVSENLGVGASKITDFTDSLFMKLNLMANYEKVKQINPRTDIKKIRKPILVVAPPSMGKTEGLYATVEKINSTIEKEEDKFYVKKIQLGQTIVGELSQIPMVLNDEVVPYESPILPTMDKYEFIKDENGQKVPNPDYHKRGVLFLDEITTASLEQVQPALGLCDGTRNINGYTLPEQWLVVAAGNGPEDTNFVRLDAMTLQRFDTFEILDVDFKRDYRPIFVQREFDPIIIGFLDTHPEYILYQDTQNNGIAAKGGSAPRPWEGVSDKLTLMKTDRVLNGKAATINDVVLSPAEIKKASQGLIGDYVAGALEAYVQINSTSEIKVEDILNGKAKGKATIKIELINYLTESCIKILRNEYQNKGNTIDDELLTKIANYLQFYIDTKNPEYGCIAILHLIMDIPDTKPLIADPGSQLCSKVPDLNTWFLSMVDKLTDSDLELFEEMCSN